MTRVNEAYCPFVSDLAQICHDDRLDNSSSDGLPALSIRLDNSWAEAAHPESRQTGPKYAQIAADSAVPSARLIQAVTTRGRCAVRDWYRKDI